VNTSLGKSTLRSHDTGRSENTFTRDEDELQRSIKMQPLCGHEINSDTDLH
jgi:hypothetical protein